MTVVSRGELILLFHLSDPNYIQGIIDSLVQPSLPLITEIDGDNVSLLENLSARQEILLILLKKYPLRVSLDNLDNWIINHKRSNIKTTLRNMKIKKLVHSNESGFRLTPKGKLEAQEIILKFEDQI